MIKGPQFCPDCFKDVPHVHSSARGWKAYGEAPREPHKDELGPNPKLISDKDSPHAHGDEWWVSELTEDKDKDGQG